MTTPVIWNPPSSVVSHDQYTHNKNYVKKTIRTDICSSAYSLRIHKLIQQENLIGHDQHVVDNVSHATRICFVTDIAPIQQSMCNDIMFELFEAEHLH